ncbi:MAG: FAD-dependent oxidoreductase [Candidatus Diapherotrites archaeon]
MQAFFESKVLSVERYSEQGKNSYLVFRTEKPSGFEFKAGQFVLLGHPGLKDNSKPSEPLYRAYSIATAPHMEFLEFAVAVSPNGGVSQFLAEHLAPGDILQLKGPFGEFLHRSQKEKIVFIVTGAGVAPAMSMVRDLMFKDSKKIIQFFYGFHSCDMFLFKEELQKYAREKPNFFLFPVAFKDGACCWNGACGYVQSLVEEAGYADSNTHFYVCGSPGSMKASFEVLKKMNVPIEKIFTEVLG